MVVQGDCAGALQLQHPTIICHCHTGHFFSILLCIYNCLSSSEYLTVPVYRWQMGSSFSKEIFEDHIQAGLVGWAQKAKNRGLRTAAAGGPSSHPQATTVEMTGIEVQVPVVNHDKIHPAA